MYRDEGRYRCRPGRNWPGPDRYPPSPAGFVGRSKPGSVPCRHAGRRCRRWAAAESARATSRNCNGKVGAENSSTFWRQGSTVKPAAMMSPRTGCSPRSDTASPLRTTSFPQQVADDVLEIGVDQSVAHAEEPGKPLRKLHVEAVTGSGDEMGVSDAQVTDLRPGHGFRPDRWLWQPPGCRSGSSRSGAIAAMWASSCSALSSPSGGPRGRSPILSLDRLPTGAPEHRCSCRMTPMRSYSAATAAAPHPLLTICTCKSCRWLELFTRLSSRRRLLRTTA